VTATQPRRASGSSPPATAATARASPPDSAWCVDEAESSLGFISPFVGWCCSSCRACC
jgi:hypothetical protein